jgi:membrane protein DedA with SNARE-associated domain
MTSSILLAVTGFITHTISVFGYPGVAFLMAVQTVAIPMPSEVIIPFAGFLASTGRFSLLMISIVGAAGSSVGASIAYYIGYKGGRPLVEKYGRYILISHHDLALAEKFFARFGSAATFVGQLLPVVRSFIGLIAGVARENYKKFVLSVFLGTFIWCLVLGYIGEKLGENWGSLRDKFKGFDAAIVIVIVMVVILWVWRHLKHRKVR